MSQSHHGSTNKSEIVKMEINGHPYYVKSKGNVPYLYDIDTNDEVGYWSSKKGQYVTFSLYNRMMKQKYNNDISSDSDLKSNSDSDGEKWSETDSISSGESSPASSSNQSSSSCDDDNQEIEEIDSSSDDEETQDILQKTSKKMNTYSIIFLFLILFTYLTLQKEFQSIYFDIIFLILINLLNTLKVFEILNDV